MSDSGFDRRWRWIAAAIVVLAAGLRVPGLFTDLWLDEIWSLLDAENLDSPLGVFTGLHTANKHHLYSVFLYIVGSPGAALHPALYRTLSFAAGVATVVIVGLITRRRGRVESLIAMYLTAICFPLVFYSSEARGYALVVLFSVCALGLLCRYAETGSRRIGIAYVVVSILGFLSNLVFLFFFVGALVWAWVRRRRGRGGSSSKAQTDLLHVHNLILIFLVLLFLLDVRHWNLTGGDPFTATGIAVETLSLSVGGPPVGALAVGAAVLAAAVLVTQLIYLRKARDDLWLLFAVVVVAFPAIVLLALPATFFYSRFLIIPIALFQLLLAGFLSRQFRRNATGKIIFVAALSALSIGNATQLAAFLTVGRGHYDEALAWIVEHSDQTRPTVGSDHDFRNSMLLEFYQRGGPGETTIRYVTREGALAGVPEWWLGSERLTGRSQPTIEVAGNRYRFETSFPSHHLSGATWRLYRLVER